MKENLENFKCDCDIIHEDSVEEVLKNLPEEGDLNLMADFFKVFSNNTRIKILYSLLNKELCVCDIANILNMKQSAISHQLRTLKQSRLVKYRREGRTIYYSLDDSHISKILTQGYNHIKE